MRRVRLSVPFLSAVLALGMLSTAPAPAESQRRGSTTEKTVIEEVALKSTEVVGGSRVSGVLRLRAPASRRGVTVRLVSSEPRLVRVPREVTVRPGRTSVDLVFQTAEVRRTTKAEIRLTVGKETHTLTLVVGRSAEARGGRKAEVRRGGSAGGSGSGGSDGGDAGAGDAGDAGGDTGETDPDASIQPASIVIEPSTPIYGGEEASATITVTAAPTQPLELAVTSSHPAAVPGSVVVQPGMTQVTVPITTSLPPWTSNFPTNSSAWPPHERAVLEVVRPPYAQGPADTLFMDRPPALSSLIVGTSVYEDPSTVVGGASRSMRVFTYAPARHGAEISLSSSDPAVTVPPSVSFEDRAREAIFSVEVAAVTEPTTVTVTATLDGPVPSQRSRTFTVVPAGGVQAISLSPSLLTGGAPVQGSLTLTTPAPAGGTTITVQSSDPGRIPGTTANVPEGERDATFSLSTTPVAEPAQVEITVASPGGSRSGIVTLRPPQATVTGPSSQVLAGGSFEATVSLDGMWPSDEPLTVSFTGDDPELLPTPVTVAIGRDEYQATATIPTAFPDDFDPVTRQATVQVEPLGESFQVTVRRPGLVSGLSFDPPFLVGGASAQGTLTLDGAAAPGGHTVQISSDDPAATPPASVTVPAGEHSTTFDLQTSTVDSDRTVTFTADDGRLTETRTMMVRGAIVLEEFRIRDEAVGGETFFARLFFNYLPAAGNTIEVALTSDHPALTLPPSVTIDHISNSRDVDVVTSPVDEPTTVTVTAEYEGTVQTGTITLLPEPAVASVDLGDPEQLGTATRTATVRLAWPATSAVDVALSSSDPSLVSVPASVTVPADAVEADFDVEVAAFTGVSSSTQVTVEAALGSSAAEAGLTLLNAVNDIRSVDLDPNPVLGGQPFEMLIRAKGPAPAQGEVVHLSTDHPSLLGLPSQVTIPGGESEVVLTVATADVDEPTTVQIEVRITDRTRTFEIVLQ